MRKSWDELIAEGERLKVMEERVEAEAGNVRWLWGDLLLEVAPIGSDHSRNGARELIEKFASDERIDREPATLRDYRRVAAAWPEGLRNHSQPWAVHHLFKDREDREELIANPVDVRTGERTDRWTFRSAQRFLGQKPSPVYQAPPTTTEDRADIIRDLAVDADAVAEALRDVGVENVVRQAIRKLDAERGPAIEASDVVRGATPEEWTEEQWAAFDKAVVKGAKSVGSALFMWHKGIYEPSVGAMTMLTLLKPAQDLDAEFEAMVSEDWSR